MRTLIIALCFANVANCEMLTVNVPFPGQSETHFSIGPAGIVVSDLPSGSYTANLDTETSELTIEPFTLSVPASIFEWVETVTVEEPLVCDLNGCTGGGTTTTETNRSAILNAFDFTLTAPYSVTLSNFSQGTASAVPSFPDIPQSIYSINPMVSIDDAGVTPQTSINRARLNTQIGLIRDPVTQSVTGLSSGPNILIEHTQRTDGLYSVQVAVPEPSSFILLGVIAIGIAAKKRLWQATQ